MNHADAWLWLAQTIAAEERRHGREADHAWEELRVTEAVYKRGIAVGLAIAQERQLSASRQLDPPV